MIMLLSMGKIFARLSGDVAPLLGIPKESHVGAAGVCPGPYG
jgi:hypothetical protein